MLRSRHITFIFYRNLIKLADNKYMYKIYGHIVQLTLELPGLEC